jgi:hypothetical protein
LAATALAVGAALLATYVAGLSTWATVSDIGDGELGYAVLYGTIAISPIVVTGICWARSGQLHLAGHDRIRYIAKGVLTFSLIAGGVLSAASAS